MARIPPQISELSLKLGPWHPLRWRRLAAFTLVLYWSLLALGTHLPGGSVGTVQYNDKLVHFLAFAGLAFLLSWTWATRRPWFPWGPIVVILGASLYAAVDELTQELVPGRTGQWGDWFADSAGAVAGASAFAILERLTRGARPAHSSQACDSPQ
jgi:VanZ family protein